MFIVLNCDSIPPERLLIFHPSEGYAPICKFLDIPEPPSSQFPKINDGRCKVHASSR